MFQGLLFFAQAFFYLLGAINIVIPTNLFMLFYCWFQSPSSLVSPKSIKIYFKVRYFLCKCFVVSRWDRHVLKSGFGFGKLLLESSNFRLVLGRLCLYCGKVFLFLNGLLFEFPDFCVLFFRLWLEELLKLLAFCLISV